MRARVVCVVVTKRPCAADDEFRRAALKQVFARQTMGGGIAGLMERLGPSSNADHVTLCNAAKDGSGNDCRDRFAAMPQVASQMHFCVSLQGALFCFAGAA